MNKPRIPTLLIYAIAISSSAFVLHDIYDLIILAIPPLVLSVLFTRSKIKWLMMAYVIGLIGVFVNALAFANSGEILLSIGSLEIRKNAVSAFTVVSLRLLSIATSGALFALSYSSVEIYRGLIHEVGAPTTLTLPLAYSLRLLPVIRKDLSEVLFQRRQRKYKTVFLNPIHFSSVVMALLAISFERAKWSGINAEIRGLRKIKPRRQYKLGYIDIGFYIALSIQLLMIMLF
ncbi:MAG: energy-coupling factor transporter transmembrane component T [Desulfurococcaceae archaeon]